jgi:dTDP-4-dehydrorhamnose reductase
MRAAVTGSHGQVGRALLRVLPDAIRVDRHHLDRVDADVIFHCAAWTDVDGCEGDPAHAMEANAGLTGRVAALGARIVYLSTDYVFDGASDKPYTESDTPNPISAYGASKLAGERVLGPNDLIVRTSWICGDGANIIATIVKLAHGDQPLRFATDQRSIPTLADDLAPMLVRMAEEERSGVWHVTNRGAVSAYELAREVVTRLGGDPSRVEPIRAAQLGRSAPRPANSELASERLKPDELLPDWRDSPSLNLRQ